MIEATGEAFLTRRLFRVEFRRLRDASVSDNFRRGNAILRVCKWVVGT